MSPEQVRGQQLDAASDIFSLGSVLYHAATGHLPFQGANSLAVLLEIVTEDARPPSERNPALPEEFDRILQPALAKDKKDRYASASDFSYPLLHLKVSLSHDLKPEAKSVEELVLPEPVASQKPRHHRKYALIAVFALILIGAILYSSLPKTDETPSLAVLPFFSGQDPGNEYVADQLTESIIKNLSQTPALRVISTGTMFRYKGTEMDPLQVGEFLKVRFILKGNLKKEASGPTLDVELLDVKNHNSIWSTHRALTDPMKLEQQIPSDIRKRLNLIETGIRQYKPENIAYQLYSRGRFFYRKKTQGSLTHSLQLYKSAAAADPGYAEIYTAMADSWIGLAGFLQPLDAFPQAKQAATKAVELNPSLAEAHTACGIVHLLYDWDFAAAEKDFRKGISLNQSDPRTHTYLAMLLTATERPEEAFAELNKGLELDPVSADLNNQIAWTLVHLRKYDEAIAICRTSAQWEQDASMYFTLGDAYLGTGQNEEALAAYRHAAELGASSAQLRTILAMVASGMQTESRMLLDGIQKRKKPESLRPDFMAAACAITGNTEKAVFWLNKAYETRVPALIMLRVDRTFDPLRADPRFQHLLRQIGIPAEQL